MSNSDFAGQLDDELIDGSGGLERGGGMDSIRLSDRMVEALDLPTENDGRVLDGTVAAHLVRNAEGGLNGINLGWRDMESSTGFLVSLVSDVDEAIDGESAEDLLSGGLDDIDAHSIADENVPVYNRERIEAVMELGLGSESLDDEGLVAGDVSMVAVAGVVLYDYGAQLVGALVETLRDVIENEGDDDEEGDE